MSDIKFFQKSQLDGNLYEQIINAINLAINKKIFTEKHGKLLINKIQTEHANNQGSINRQDLTNLPKNIELTISNQELINIFNNKISQLDQNRNELEIAYEYIAILDDCINDFQEIQKNKAKQQAEEAKISAMRQQEENEKQKQLDEMEGLLDGL